MHVLQVHARAQLLVGALPAGAPEPLGTAGLGSTQRIRVVVGLGGITELQAHVRHVTCVMWHVTCKMWHVACGM